MILILNLKKSMNYWRKIMKTEENEVQMPTGGITGEGEEGIKEGTEDEMGIAKMLGI